MAPYIDMGFLLAHLAHRHAPMLQCSRGGIIIICATCLVCRPLSRLRKKKKSISFGKLLSWDFASISRSNGPQTIINTQKNVVSNTSQGSLEEKIVVNDKIRRASRNSTKSQDIVTITMSGGSYSNNLIIEICDGFLASPFQVLVPIL